MNNFDLYKAEYDRLFECSIRLKILKDFLKTKKETGKYIEIEEIEFIIADKKGKEEDVE